MIQVKYTLLILLVLLIVFCYLEVRDLKAFLRAPSVQTKQGSEKEELYTFYACASYENGVIWRSVMIGSIIATFVLSYFLYIAYGYIESWMILMLLFIVFVVFYLIASFRNFHLDRVICSKARNNMRLIEDMH